MSYIPDLHDYSAESAEKMDDKAKEYITPTLKENLRKEINQIFDQEYDRLEEYAAEFLENCAAHRAEEFFKRVLDGDNKAAMALLGDRDNRGRYSQLGHDKGKPWPYMIHGSLFETDGIKMRRKIVEAFPDLITSERIKDLEAIVDGLQQQIVKMEKQMERIMSQPDC